MKYVVIGGYEPNFHQCLGVFDNAAEAYGTAYLYLDDIVDTGDPENKDKLKISPLYPLTGETGYIMHLEGVEDITDYAEVLFKHDEGEGKFKGEI